MVEDLRRRVDALAPWFHDIDLGEDVQTAPDHHLGDLPALKHVRFAGALPADLGDASALDTGCNSGFYCVEMRKRGAGRVPGVDPDGRHAAKARLACDTLGFGDVEYARLSVCDVGAPGEKFDPVVIMGVLHHLRHALLALDLIRGPVGGDRMLFQTTRRDLENDYAGLEDHPFPKPGAFDRPDHFDDPAFSKLHFIERRFAGDWTNWWAPNRSGTEATLSAAVFSIQARPEGEVHLCRAVPAPYAEWGPAAAYPAKGEIGR